MERQKIQTERANNEAGKHAESEYVQSLEEGDKVEE